MDVSHVRQRVQAIADAAPDFEVQHSREDDLFVDVLTEIANTSTDDHARALARASLESRRLAFERACA
ncbi:MULTISPECIES: hypothetical protein [Streptomyces]|uniref:Uncharacterized protein n=2 Tax=Streptomyces TaxID=1883 RepID=A0A2U9P085_STRAS|nr:hypothetical protein [Streptomyces actuosus]AWT42565.1 hypothetical protein DMT42_09730 [Streptomyces actuosus]MBM4819773.1 hypothetical protein [Streptomyces actuosus]